MSIFQRLYDLEINFSVSTFWDGGFDVKLGDRMNGFKAEGNVDSWREVEAWLDYQSRIHFSHLYMPGVSDNA